MHDSLQLPIRLQGIIANFIWNKRQATVGHTNYFFVERIKIALSSRHLLVFLLKITIKNGTLCLSYHCNLNVSCNCMVYRIYRNCAHRRAVLTDGEKLPLQKAYIG